MKSAYLLLLLSVIAPTTEVSATERLTIEISTLTHSVKSGSDVWVTIKITNRSNTELDESGSISNMTGMDPNLVVEVRDTRGRMAERRVHELASGSPVNRQIKPGETLAEEQNIALLYDITKPGSYVVQVSRSLPPAARGEVAASNKITIVVTQ